MLLEMELPITDIDIQHAVQSIVGDQHGDLFIIAKEIELRFLYETIGKGVLVVHLENGAHWH